MGKPEKISALLSTEQQRVKLAVKRPVSVVPVGRPSSLAAELHRIGNSMLRYQATVDNPKPFHLDEERRKYYQLVYWYFMRNARFLALDSTYSFRKGLLLCGGVGTGKSLLMQVFSQMVVDEQRRRVFIVVSTDQMQQEFLTDGMDVIDRYSKKCFYRNGDAKAICIDDLGMEDKELYSFKNRVNIMSQILFARHRYQLSNGMLTHATTNHSGTELQKFYGVRVGDRLKEMFNIVVMDGKSLRK